jgi:hypothetical protein
LRRISKSCATYRNEILRNKGGGGSRKVRTVTNSDGSKTDYDPDTGEELKHYPAKSGGGKAADQDKARESYMKDREFIRGAETADELATYLTSVGVEVPARDSRDVMNAPINNEEDHYVGVLRSLAAKAADARIGGGSKPGASEDNPVTTATKADVEKLPKGTWFVTPAGKVYQK